VLQSFVTGTSFPTIRKKPEFIGWVMPMKEVATGTRNIGTKNAGYHYPFNPIVPNRWQGEADCVVGPFSSRTVAEYFVSAVADFGHYDAFNKRVFAKGDAYYVEVIENEPIKTAVIES
jgi:hypothetical protein